MVPAEMGVHRSVGGLAQMGSQLEWGVPARKCGPGPEGGSPGSSPGVWGVPHNTTKMMRTHTLGSKVCPGFQPRLSYKQNRKKMNRQSKEKQLETHHET